MFRRPRFLCHEASMSFQIKMDLLTVLLLYGCFSLSCSQQPGTNTEEQHPPITITVCDGTLCQDLETSFVLTGDYRGSSSVIDGSSCQDQNGWDPDLCPDGVTCAQNCAIDAVDENGYTNVYGVTTSDRSLRINFVTESAYMSTVGAGGYLVAPSDDKYQIFKLKNRELSVEIDSSALPCGLNGALFFSEMEEDGGMASYPTNQAGAKYGLGTCDAQCKHSFKFRLGEVNIEGDQSPLGVCCAELDIWEANSMAQTYTTHGCNIKGLYTCEGTDCGDGEDRYNGVCDKDGCEFGAFRLNQHEFYGPGPSYAVDSSRPVTLVTQFITADGTDEGDLVEIRRLYVQDGNVVQNTFANYDGITQYDSITDEFCQDYKDLFGQVNDAGTKGGLRVMGEALDRGMVLIFSLWADYGSYMLWLDSINPPDADPSIPGVWCGPCPTDSGRPDDLIANYPDAYVTFSNIIVGPINSTFSAVFN